MSYRQDKTNDVDMMLILYCCINEFNRIVRDCFAFN